jgi:hypothetical protein
MDVNIVGSGPQSNIEAQTDPTYQAIRTSLRATDWTTFGGVIGGHYHAGAMTGLMAAGIASAAQVFQVRWADPVKLFVLKKLTVQCATATGFAATTLGAPLELILGHGSTANGSGGTALTLSSISNRMRATMAASGFATSGEIRIATTAALTAATGQALELAAVSGCQGAPNITLTQSPVMMLYEMRDFGSHPLILNSGDSLAVRTNVPAGTGTWYAYFTMEWLETASY